MRIESHGIGRRQLRTERRADHAKQIQPGRIQIGAGLRKLHLLARQARFGPGHIEPGRDAGVSLVRRQIEKPLGELHIRLRRRHRLAGLEHLDIRQGGRRR